MKYNSHTICESPYGSDQSVQETHFIMSNSKGNSEWWSSYLDESSWNNLNTSEIHLKLQTILDNIENYRIINNNGKSDPLCRILIKQWSKILKLSEYLPSANPLDDNIDDSMETGSTVQDDFSSKSRSGSGWSRWIKGTKSSVTSLTGLSTRRWSCFSLLTSIWSMLLSRSDDTTIATVGHLSNDYKLFEIIFYSFHCYLDSYWFTTTDMMTLKRLVNIYGKAVSLLLPHHISVVLRHDVQESILSILPLLERLVIHHCFDKANQPNGLMDLRLLEILIESQRDVIKSLIIKHQIHLMNSFKQSTYTITLSKDYLIGLVKSNLLTSKYYSWQHDNNTSVTNLLLDYLFDYLMYSLYIPANRGVVLSLVEVCCECRGCCVIKLLLNLSTGNFTTKLQGNGNLGKVFLEQLVYIATAIVQSSSTTSNITPTPIASPVRGNPTSSNQQQVTIVTLSPTDRDILTNLFYCIANIFFVNKPAYDSHTIVGEEESNSNNDKDYVLKPEEEQLMTLLFQPLSNSSSSSSSQSATTSSTQTPTRRPLLMLRNQMSSSMSATTTAASSSMSFMNASTNGSSTSSISGNPTPSISPYNTFHLHSWLEDLMIIIEQQLLQSHCYSMTHDTPLNQQTPEYLDMLSAALSIIGNLFTYLLSNIAYAYNYRQLQQYRDSNNNSHSASVNDVMSNDQQLLHPSALHQHRQQYYECDAVLKLLSLSTITKLIQIHYKKVYSQIITECYKLLSLQLYAINKKQEMNYTRCDHLYNEMNSIYRLCYDIIKYRIDEMNELQRRDNNNKSKKQQHLYCIYQILIMLTRYLQLLPIVMEILLQRSNKRQGNDNNSSRDSNSVLLNLHIDIWYKYWNVILDKYNDNIPLLLQSIQLSTIMIQCYNNHSSSDSNTDNVLDNKSIHVLRNKEMNDSLIRYEFMNVIGRLNGLSNDGTMCPFQCIMYKYMELPIWTTFEPYSSTLPHTDTSSSISRGSVSSPSGYIPRSMRSNEQQQPKYISHACSVDAFLLTHPELSLPPIPVIQEKKDCVCRMWIMFLRNLLQQSDKKVSLHIAIVLIRNEWLLLLCQYMVRLEQRVRGSVIRNGDDSKGEEVIETIEPDESVSDLLTMVQDVFMSILRVPIPNRISSYQPRIQEHRTVPNVMYGAYSSALIMIARTLIALGKMRACDSTGTSIACKLHRCYYDEMMITLSQWLQKLTIIEPTKLCDIVQILYSWLNRKMYINTGLSTMSVIVALGHARDTAGRTMVKLANGSSEADRKKEIDAWSKLAKQLTPLIKTSLAISLDQKLHATRQEESKQIALNTLVVDHSFEIMSRLKENYDKKNAEIFDRVFEVKELYDQVRSLMAASNGDKNGSESSSNSLFNFSFKSRLK